MRNLPSLKWYSRSKRPGVYFHAYTFTGTYLNPHRMRGGTPDEALFKDLIGKLSTKLDVYNEILAKQKYLAGNVSQVFRHFVC